MIGSTLGAVLCCSRKAKDGKDVVLNRYKAHHGPIRSLQRNPLFPKNFLTAGDWSMKIWSEDITSSPLQWVWSGDKMITPNHNIPFFKTRWAQSYLCHVESCQTFCYICLKAGWIPNGIIQNVFYIYQILVFLDLWCFIPTRTFTWGLCTWWFH